MKKYLLFFTIVFLISCSKNDNNIDAPNCVKQQIEQFSRSNAICNNATIEEYFFQNKIVYVLNIGTCGADFGASVIDSDCNSIGFLGGLVGNTILNGESFSNAKYIRTVWKK